MANVLLIVLLIISIILTGLILIQRSEGGALGIGGGGGGGGGGLMSGRGTANMVTKLTTIFGIAFMTVCVLISISFNYQDQDGSIFDASKAQQGIVTDQDGTVKEQETENPPLNSDVDTGNDATPLAEDSNSEESDAKPQDKPQEDPQD